MWFVTVCSALIITIFCLANRSHVEIDIWPFPFKPQVQLFALLLACIGIGMIWGGFAAWLSAGNSRKKARKSKRRAIAAELDASHAKKRYSKLEQSLHDLRAQEKSNQYKIETSSPFTLSSNGNKA